MLLTDAASGKNAGGIVTYGKGSFQEKVCGTSNYFLEILLQHAEGDYQIKVLREILIIFIKMITTHKFPITDNDSAVKLVETMVPVITKAGI